jgi:hypothetical protein
MICTEGQTDRSAGRLLYSQIRVAALYKCKFELTFVKKLMYRCQVDCERVGGIPNVDLKLNFFTKKTQQKPLKNVLGPIL